MQDFENSTETIAIAVVTLPDITLDIKGRAPDCSAPLAVPLMVVLFECTTSTLLYSCKELASLTFKVLFEVSTAEITPTVKLVLPIKTLLGLKPLASLTCSTTSYVLAVIATLLFYFIKF